MESIDHSRCGNCGRWRPSDSLTQRLCGRCRVRGLIRSYDTNVLDFFSPQPSKKDKTKKARGKKVRNVRYYGIELEVEPTIDRLEAATNVVEAIGTFCILKRDGSLSEEGFEIVSTPMTFDYHRSGVWDNFFINGGNSGLRTPNTCGMHIHISRNTLTRLQIGKMVSFIHNPSNRRFIKGIAERSANRYMDYTVEKKITEPLFVEGSHDERYTALNLIPRATVELRIFQATVKPETFFKNLEFTDALVNFCDTGLSIAESSDCQLFKVFVFRERKRYPNLWAFMLEKDLMPKFRDAKEVSEFEAEVRNLIFKTKSEKEAEAMKIPTSQRSKKFFGSSRRRTMSNSISQNDRLWNSVFGNASNFSSGSVRENVHPSTSPFRFPSWTYDNSGASIPAVTISESVNNNAITVEVGVLASGAIEAIEQIRPTPNTTLEAADLPLDWATIDDYANDRLSCTSDGCSICSEDSNSQELTLAA